MKELKILGKTLHRTTIFFIAQVIAFWLMIIGFLILVWLWYKGSF